MVDFKKAISEYYEREINIIKNLNLDELNESMNAILDTYNNGGTFGNFGSSVLDFLGNSNDYSRGI